MIPEAGNGKGADMYRTGLAVLLALAFSGCMDAADVFIEENPPDVVINQVCPCVAGSGSHDVYITEEVYETVYVTEEDTTPDVVQEFYGDASSLPVLLLSGTGDPMPKKITDPLIAVATTVNPADRFYLEQGGASKSLAASILPLPTNSIGGLITSNDVSDLDHDIAISPGVARGLADDANLRLASILTKQIDVAWAVGDDAGGIDTGSVAADTLYAIWLIKRSDTGVVDALFSLSFTAPTMPADYDKKRLIAAVVTDGSANIIAYIQSGDEFTLLSNVGVVTDSTLTTGVFETATIPAPPLSMLKIFGQLNNPSTTGNAGSLRIQVQGGSDTTADDVWMKVETSGTFDNMIRKGEVMIDANRQLEYRADFTDGSPTIEIELAGWTMLTRREP